MERGENPSRSVRKKIRKYGRDVELFFLNIALSRRRSSLVLAGNRIKRRTSHLRRQISFSIRRREITIAFSAAEDEAPIGDTRLPAVSCHSD